MNPWAVGLLILALGVAAFAVFDGVFNGLDLLGFIAAGGAVTVQIPRRTEK